MSLPVSTFAIKYLPMRLMSDYQAQRQRLIDPSAKVWVLTVGNYSAFQTFRMCVWIPGNYM